MMKLERGLLYGAVLALAPLAPAWAQDADTDVTIVLQTQPDQLDPCQSSKSQVGRVLRQNIGNRFSTRAYLL